MASEKPPGEQRMPQWIPILGYHRVVAEVPANDYWNVCATRDRFQRQMAWFARLGWRTLSLEEAGERLVRGEPIPRRHFVITFDDGYLDTFTTAIPILRAHGFTATIFMVAGMIGQESSWDAGYSWVAPLLDWPRLKEARRLGFSIGSHTVSHPHLSQLPLEQARAEITESRRILAEGLGEPITTFCYPFGDWNAAITELVAEAGYQVACDNLGRHEHGRYYLARTNPAYWPPLLTPLVRSQRWYFALNRSGWLSGPQRAMGALRRGVTGRSQPADFQPKG